MGMEICKYDSAFFTWYKADILEGIACVHVDDILYAGTDNFL